MPEITDQEYEGFRRFIYQTAGIELGDSRKILVTSRLGARLRDRGVGSYAEYLRLLTNGADTEEIQTAVDLLTTNETYFFREPRHFDFLRDQLTGGLGAEGTSPVRIWSAAGSTGEEAYSIAMVLEDCLQGRPWEVVASDISSRVLERARGGLYPLERARTVPLRYLQRFCLRGPDESGQMLLVQRGLRQKLQFHQINLDAPLPSIGLFDFIFLRNVLIYFNPDTRRRVITRVLSALKPGGYFLIGHAESLQDINPGIRVMAPSIYVKQPAGAESAAAVSMSQTVGHSR